jgi:hypothetical protein
MSDHSQTTVEAPISLADAFADARVLAPADPAPTEAELAVSPAARSAMVYALDARRRDELVAAAVATLRGTEGVDLVATRENGEAVVLCDRGELRFRPGDDHTDRRGRSWRLSGERAVLDLDGETYPDALNRLWSALECPHSGDVLASAELGYEFVDWGGADHVGGGSHGSLHRDDSEGVLLICGVETPALEEWSITDATGLVLQHFGVPLQR